MVDPSPGTKEGPLTQPREGYNEGALEYVTLEMTFER